MAMPKQEKDMDRQPFLGKEHHDWDSTNSRSSTVDEDEFPPRIQGRRHSFRWTLLFHIALIFTYTAIFFIVTKVHFKPSSIRPRLNYCISTSSKLHLCKRQTKNLAAPAAGAVEYVTKAVDGLATDSIYAGDPNPELDDAWHKLLASTHSSIHSSPPGSQRN